MILPLLQLAVIAAIGSYFYCWRRNVSLRKAQTWESLLARLRSEWSARELNEQFLWREGVSTTPSESWHRMEGPKGLWVMFQNAGVMLEMASHAGLHCEGADPVLVSSLHSDAMRIRVYVLTALAQYVFAAASEGVRDNAHRAASLYVSMAARMTTLLQSSNAALVPNFAAAM